MVNRLLYRARQRGFLELDLLVGVWAEHNIPLMGTDALAAFSEVPSHPMSYLKYAQPHILKLSTTPYT